MKRTAHLVSLLTALAACEPAPTPPPAATAMTGTAPVTTTAPSASTRPASLEVEPGGAAAPVAQASNAFGFQLYDRLAGEPGNLAFSPASVSFALAMTYAGARGPTAEQMQKVLHLPAGDEVHGMFATAQRELGRCGEGCDIALANRLFGEVGYTFEPEFLRVTKERYGAPLEPVRFAADPAAQRAHINRWVEERTHGKIVDLLPPAGVTGDTRLVLTNALYLRARWATPFDKDHTAEGDFTTAAGAVAKTPMMHLTTRARYGETDEAQLLELPYVSGELSFVVVLPKEGKRVAALAPSPERWSTWLAALGDERVAVTLPRFRIETASLPLGDHLVAMGMPLAFQRGVADFTGIAKPPSPADRLHIDKVYHKAFIAVDEAGTEAAAATAVSMARAGSAPAEPKVFTADRPFVFFVRHKGTGMVLFGGRLDDPSA